MKTRFLLKRRGNTKGSSHPIFIALYEGEATELIFTGQRITLNDWSSSDRLPKNQKGTVFKEIAKVMGSVDKAKIRLEAADQPITPYTIKKEYERWSAEKANDQLGKDKNAKSGSKTVYKLVEFYQDNLPVNLKKTTAKTVKSSLDQFREYIETSGQRALESKDLSEDIIAGYGKYLLDKKQLADSTYNVRMKHLNWFLKTIKFNGKVVKRKLKKRAIIALTIPELRALEEADVTKIDLSKYDDVTSHEYLQRAKDMFLIGCYTSLRISDLKRINPTNSAGGYIKLTTQKNNELFSIHIVAELQAILTKYKGWAPKISEQEVNRSIKKVCEHAKINTPVEVEYTKGGKDLIKTFKKFELISSHIAVKTFISNARELWNLEPADVVAIVRKDFKTMVNSYFRPDVERATLKMISADQARVRINRG